MDINPYISPNGASPIARPGEQVMPPATPPAPLTPAQSVQEMKKAVGNAHQVLLTATTIFPFTLFPDTVTLDREKLTISHRLFFRVAEVMSIRIEDILNVTADVGPFFGSIKISTRFFDARKPYSVNYLWRHDALRFKRVVQGYIIAMQKGIDSSAFVPDQLTDMLDKLGQGAPHDES